MTIKKLFLILSAVTLTTHPLFAMDNDEEKRGFICNRDISNKIIERIDEVVTLAKASCISKAMNALVTECRPVWYAKKNDWFGSKKAEWCLVDTGGMPYYFWSNDQKAAHKAPVSYKVPVFFLSFIMTEKVCEPVALPGQKKALYKREINGKTFGLLHQCAYKTMHRALDTFDHALEQFSHLNPNAYVRFNQEIHHDNEFQPVPCLGGGAEIYGEKDVSEFKDLSGIDSMTKYLQHCKKYQEECKTHENEVQPIQYPMNDHFFIHHFSFLDEYSIQQEIQRLEKQKAKEPVVNGM